MCDIVRSVRSACCCVLRAMLPDYTLSQYRPSLLAYCLLQTVIELCHDDHCVTAGEETTSTAPTVGLEAVDISDCTIAVRNFLHATGSRIVRPVFY